MSGYGFAFRRPDINVTIGESDLTRPVVDKPKIADPFSTKTSNKNQDRLPKGGEFKFNPEAK